MMGAGSWKSRGDDVSGNSPLRRLVQHAVALATIGLVGTGALEAQRVTLRIHPHTGDTLHMRLDQRFEMTGEVPPISPGSQPHPLPPPTQAAPVPPSSTLPTFGRGLPPTAMIATMRICTHSIILASTLTGTDLQSITDSVAIAPAPAAAIPLFAQTKRALEKRTVRLHIGTDGAMTLPKSASATGSVPPETVMLGQIPAVLPSMPVQPGDSWARDLLVPLSASPAKDGLVRISFHLDSLGPDAAIAYISLHGTFSHDRGRSGSGAQDQPYGTLTGTMQVDRRLEWLTDSRMTVTLTSTVTSPTSGTPASHPMLVHVKITQWLRAVPGS
jgi:hypothetical protein